MFYSIKTPINERLFYLGFLKKSSLQKDQEIKSHGAIFINQVQFHEANKAFEYKSRLESFKWI